MLTITDLTYRIGGRVLLEAVTLAVREQEPSPFTTQGLS